MKQLYPDHIQTYINLVTDQPTPAQEKLLEYTAGLSQSVMQTPHDQCAFLSMLVASMNARKVIEVGVFTGYGTLAMASALPDNGTLVACDKSAEWAEAAHKHWSEAGQEHKIDLRIGPALDTLKELLDAGQQQTFDFIYIDADKKGYEAYYEASLQLIKPNGIIALDNMLWRGEVAKENPDDKFAKVLRELAIKISEDTRVNTSMLPVGDGLFLVRKK